LFPACPGIPAPEFCALGVETPGLPVCARAGIAAEAMKHSNALTIFFIVPPRLFPIFANVPGSLMFLFVTRLARTRARSIRRVQQTVEAMTRFFQARGSNASEAASQAIAWVGQTLQHQVDLLAYIDVFWSLAMIGAIMIPIAFSLKSIDLGSSPKGH
jgi:hypothetical protein